MAQRLNYNQEGSAILLSLFILSAIMLIVFGGSSVIMSGLKMSGIESQSTRAYFAAETGAERLLYEYRKTEFSSDFNWIQENADDVFVDTLPTGGAYTVNYGGLNPITFTSIGSFQDTKRSVELNF